MSAQLFVSLLTIVVVANAMLAATAYLILLERKIAAWVQDRIGPNRVGFSFGQRFLPQFSFWGLGQPIADGIKMFLKEDYTPPFVERKLFILAPIVAFIPALVGWAVIPWGGYWEFPGLNVLGWQIAQPGPVLVAAANLDLGIIYTLGVGSLAVYGVVLGGYASNNKYSFLGGLRATAQMLSYEVPLGLSVLVILLMVGSTRLDMIVNLQADGRWLIVYQPLLAVLVFACQLAEANRAPFDLAETEQELVGGYHTEYSSMKFALFYLGEYLHVTAAAALFSVLFLGGYDLPFVREPLVGGVGLVLLRLGVMAAKILLLVAVVMLVRWTLPRFRYDQLMRLAWRGLIPAALAVLVISGGLTFAAVQGWVSRPAAHWLMLAGNVAVAVVVILVGPWLPSDAPGGVNRRVPLRGSRFRPAPAEG